MRTVHIETILKLANSLFTGVSELPGAEDYPVFRGFMDLSLAECWEREKWTDLLRDEERTPDADGLIEWEQAGETALGEVYGAYDANRRITEDYGEIIIRVTHEGVQVVAFTTGDTVWLNYRLRRPELTGDTFDTTAAYAVGEQVYFSATGTPGNLYNCVTATAAGESPVSAAAKWALVEIPYIFQGYLVWSVYSKLLEADGQTEKAASAGRAAESYLALEADKNFRQSAGQEPLRIRSY